MDSGAYTIALYIRLSSEDSKVGSYSIEGQRRILHKYVENMEGVANPNVLEFVDNGYSGTTITRRTGLTGRLNSQLQQFAMPRSGT